MDLADQKVLITGGSTGIGLALARAFRSAGSQVTICARDRQRLDAAARDIDATPIPTDLTNPEELAELPSQAAAAMGGISVLINNAGIQFNYGFPDAASADVLPMVEQEVALNLEVPAKLTSLCLPMLAQEPSPAIVNVSSGLAIVPKASAPIYCATKAALHSFSKALRYQIEDAGSSVKVFEVLPPLVDTDMTRGRGSDKISPERVARETLRGMRVNRYEIRVAKVGLLFWLNRFVPRVAERILRDA